MADEKCREFDSTERNDLLTVCGGNNKMHVHGQKKEREREGVPCYFKILCVVVCVDTIAVSVFAEIKRKTTLLCR